MGWMLRCRRLLFGLVAMAVVSTGSVFAQTSSSACDDLGATGSTLATGVECILEKIAPGPQMVAILVLLIPVILMVWGSKSGFSIVKAVFRGVTGIFRRAT